jgi:alpha-mannosidase
MAKPQKTTSPIRITGSPSLVLDTVKRSEDDEGVSITDLPTRPGKSVILRVYDSLGGISHGRIETTWPVKKVFKCNILEDDEEEYKIENGMVDIMLRRFEVATFRLQIDQ